MKIIRDLNLPATWQCAITIGNFDGVHKGHQAVIANVIATAKTKGLKAIAIVFEPQPLEFFQQSEAPARITNFRDKMHYLAQTGLDGVVVIQFCKHFANLSPQEFVENILVDALNVKALLVGEDFRFGKNRAGNIALLRELAPQYEFDLDKLPNIEFESARVSSTQVRQALESANFDLAASLLGRRYQIQGHVLHGDKRGQTIGFPTANIALKRLVSPLRGVYVVKMHGLEKNYYGVCNIGNRPTVDGKTWLLETHVFDLNTDLYGKTLTIEPMAKIRDEKKFAGLAELKLQIAEDVQAAKIQVAE